MTQEIWWGTASGDTPVAPGSLAPRPSRGVVIGSRRAPISDQRTAQEIAKASRLAPLEVPQAKANLRATELSNLERERKLEQDSAIATPGNTSLTGENYLKSLPRELAAQVRALSDGRRAFPTGSALRDPATKLLIAAASQYDPLLDAANAATRVATRKDFTSGQAARNITSFNTALGHLGTLWEAAQGLENRGSPLWNTIANSAESMTGDARMVKFNTAKQAVVSELERAFRGTAGSLTGIKDWEASLNSSESPEQLRVAIGTAVDLLGSRIKALGDQYNGGMGKSSDPLSLLHPHAQAVFNALAPGGSGQIDTPPAVGPAGGSGGPSDGGGSPPLGNSRAQGPSGAFDMPDTPLEQGQVASGATRTDIDRVASAKIEALIRDGKTAAQINEALAGEGVHDVSQAQVTAAQRYLAKNPNYHGFVNQQRTVPQTLLQQAAATPVAAGIAGATNAATMGYMDEIGGGVAALAGGDYEKTRDSLDRNKKALAQTFPKSNMVGNIAGGLATTIGGPLALGRFAPGALAAATNVVGRAGALAPAATDFAYGAAYGAGEDNADRFGGAVKGGMAATAGGAVFRAGARGLSAIASPIPGALAPVYEAGVFPTIGQRAAGMTGPIGSRVGRAVNTVEQAAQSIPGVGAFVARARQIPRDQYQLGAFDNSLDDIGRELPAGTAPGTEPHAFATEAFGDAYDRARAGMQFNPDPQYAADLATHNAGLGNGILDANQAEQVRRVIETAVTSRIQPGAAGLDGAGYQAAASDLGRAARAWGRNPATAQQAHALNDYVTIFDNSARRNSHLDAVAALDAADTGYAKLVRIQNASQRVGGEPGTFTPRGFDRAVQQEAGGVRSGPYLRGDALMQDYATAGRPLADTLPNSGSAERLMTGQVLGGGVLGGAAAAGAPVASAASSPFTIAALAPYLPGMNYLTTRAIAPNSARLPGALGLRLDALGAQINDRAPFIGRLGVPAALALEQGQ